MDVNLLDLSLDRDPLKPKYLRLADAIVSGIESGKLKVNQRLPSVNKISNELNISRETVFKALNHLSEKGVVKSANRQGYYVQKTDVRTSLRVFFLMDKLTSFKEQIYRSFLKTVADYGEVDVYFHHHNYPLFRSLIEDNLNNYTHFIIVTFFRQDVSDILNLIPPEKRIIIDSYEPDLQGDYGMVYQDFASNILEALESASEHLKKYQRLVLVAPGSLYHADWVTEGLVNYGKKSGYPVGVVTHVEPEKFRKGDVYITITSHDRELVEVIKMSRKNGYVIGRDIGIISYNDTPVKEVLEGGITVISTDFEHMGSMAADMVVNRKFSIISNPSKLILRNSL